MFTKVISFSIICHLPTSVLRNDRLPIKLCVLWMSVECVVESIISIRRISLSTKTTKNNIWISNKLSVRVFVCGAIGILVFRVSWIYSMIRLISWHHQLLQLQCGCGCGCVKSSMWRFKLLVVQSKNAK